MADIDRPPQVFRPARREVDEGPSPARPFWRIAGYCGLALLTTVIVAAAICGMAYVRLAHGPVSLKVFAGSIERGINAELSGLTARIDDVFVGVSEAGAFELQLTNVQIRQDDGSVVATVPRTALEISRPALWRMRLVPSRIDLIDATLSLVYGADHRLSVSFAPTSAAGGPLSGSGGSGSPEGIDAGASRLPPPKLDIALMIQEATNRARTQLDASSYLKQIGIRESVVTLDDEGARSQWRVIEGVVEIAHEGARSVISGEAAVGSQQGPWHVAFRSEDRDGEDGVALTASVRGLVPRTLGLAIPQLNLLKTFDAPITGEANFRIVSGGAVSQARIAMDVGRGQFLLPEVADVPFAIDKGNLTLSFDGATNRFTLEPSLVSWGQSHIALTGSASSLPTSGTWAFDLKTTSGQLTADEFSLPPLVIDQGVVKGSMVPARGEVIVDVFSFRAGKTVFASNGQFSTGTTPGSGGTRFDATLSPSNIDVLKVLWPRSLSPGARNWFGTRMTRGNLKSASLRFTSGSYAGEGSVRGPDGVAKRFTVAMEGSDLSAKPLAWLSPIDAPRALLSLENNALEVTVPDAVVAIGPNKRIALKVGRFSVGMLNAEPPEATITFKALSGLVPVLDVLDQSPLHLLAANGLTTEGLDGKVEAQVKLSLPLIADLDSKSVKIEAKARVSDGRAKQFVGAFDIQAATIAVDVSDVAVGVTGDMLANGVAVKLGWQRILEDNGEKQPPLRLSATLDNADRAQLGLDVNQHVQGEVPVEILIEKGAADAATVRLRADLTAAEIHLEALAWRKPRGQSTTLGADVVRGKVNKFELQNLKVVGDDLAIEGSLGIGADNRLREITLSSFALNVITRLEVQAGLKMESANDKVGLWHVRVRGQNFDARDLFKSLFSVGTGNDKTAKPTKPSAGMDLDLEVDNVLGHSEVSLHGLRMKLMRRADKLVSLDARATIDGGAPVALSMVPQEGQPRRLRADTPDAGQAFKLIGFYPNMQLGRARMEINVDGRGPAEKTGTVWVEDFRILGDPIVSEVLGSVGNDPADDAKAARAARRRGQQREVFEFNKMQVPFSVGYGQFVIENAFLRGPLLGVNLVGKADFKLNTLNLGGTYIPLQGLNNAFSDVPLLGAIVSGPKGDGAFGITFAVQGPMSQPQVLVNPLSIVAPGIFREIFAMTNPNPKVIPRDEKAPSQPVEKRVRASSSAAGEASRTEKPSPDKTPRKDPIDGWASQTAPARTR